MFANWCDARAQAQGAWSSSITIPLLAVPLLLLSLSFRLQRYLCGGFLCEAEATHTEARWVVLWH